MYGVDGADAMGDGCWPMLAQLVEGVANAVYIDVLWIGCSDPASTTLCTQLFSKALLSDSSMLAWQYNTNGSAREWATMEERKRGD